MGQTVFTTCVHWTLTLITIQQRHQKSVARRHNGRRRKCTWRHASVNVNILWRSSPLLMGYWVWMRRLIWTGYPAASQQTCCIPTPGRDDTSRVSFPTYWCGPHTGASGISGYRRTISAYSAHSGRTAPVSTFSDRCAGRTPYLAKLPPQPAPQIHRAWGPKPPQQLQGEHHK